MKRVWIALLVAVLVFSLAACGSEYAELTAMLDAGNYDGAIQYIEGLADKADDDNVDSEETQRTPSKLLPLAYGTWSTSSDDEEVPATLTFKEDGTCTIGDEAYTWREREGVTATDDRLELNIYKGDTLSHRAGISVYRDDADVYMSLGKVDENMTNYIAGNYRNLAHFKAVAVTAENWADYFAFNEEPQFQKDAFGDVEDFVMNQRFVLQEKHLEGLNSRLTKAAVELTYINTYKGITVDLKNEQYILTDQVEPISDKVSSYTGTLFFNSDGQFRINLSTAGYWSVEEGARFDCLSNYRTQMTVTRLESTLYYLAIDELIQ